MPFIKEPLSISPREFELAVKGILDASGASIPSYESSHLEPVIGFGGEYIIDVVARFRALGADFVVLIECKHHKRKVERQDVQVLHSKVSSTGAHKGMLFSVSGFQSGAIEYADAHGIALIQLAAGSSSWFTKSAGPETPPPPFANIPEYVGWWHHDTHMSLVSERFGEYTLKALGLASNEP
ncbi:restriction endonuclease [Hydrocarboniphaga sp.]|uniref:restriction endonuclease n=1 Tax=Hydrocarboniphaga sp. TaxID=2033016 RepID=UPI003D148E17